MEQVSKEVCLYYSALVQTLERSKKKYQSRQKKLEQQMLGMMERHSALVSSVCFLLFNTEIHVVCTGP
jgi:hypothetical protein